jgi:hypothetical protein
MNYLVSGDFCEIVYGVVTHPLLKLSQDMHIDKLRDETPFYDYGKLQEMSAPSSAFVKKEELSDHHLLESSEEEFDGEENESEEDDCSYESEMEKNCDGSLKEEVKKADICIYESDDSKVKT